VTLPDRPLVVTDDRGKPVRLRVTTAQGGAGLVGAPETPIPVGAYDVAYRVVGQDGDLISGTFAFGVATPVGAAGVSARAGVSGGGAPETVPVGTTALRSLLFLGVAVALGRWLVRLAGRLRDRRTARSAATAPRGLRRRAPRRPRPACRAQRRGQPGRHGDLARVRIQVRPTACSARSSR